MQSAFQKMKTKIGKLGIIAGGGRLPHLLIDECKHNKIDFFILAIDGSADKSEFGKHAENFNIAKIGGALKLLKQQEVTDVVFAGTVKRPALTKLRPDMEGVKVLAKILKKNSLGDDSILKMIIEHIEQSGFNVIGAHEVAKGLLSEKGSMTKKKPGRDEVSDIEYGANLAFASGVLDIGQAFAVKEKRVVALEAAEGTDEMIKRAGKLCEDAILIKVKKPGQEVRADLPTIGVETVKLASEENFAGIAVEAGGCLIIDKEKTYAAANKAGLFIFGFEADWERFEKWKKEKFSLCAEKSAVL